MLPNYREHVNKCVSGKTTCLLRVLAGLFRLDGLLKGSTLLQCEGSVAGAVSTMRHACKPFKKLINGSTSEEIALVSRTVPQRQPQTPVPLITNQCPSIIKDQNDNMFSSGREVRANVQF